MDIYKNSEIWFVTGSQHLYGEETLEKVKKDSEIIAACLDKHKELPVKVVFKSVLTSSDTISELCSQANHDAGCIGLISWMHTFSPAKMWLNGLKLLTKPMLHFHTQFNRDIPWNEIDMDFMNLNQSAHGGREFGFAGSRLRLDRKVVVGHWKDKACMEEIAIWSRAVAALADTRKLRVARFGDNMRDVAVTEGDKVSAQIQMNYSVHGYGVGDLVKECDDISGRELDNLIDEYGDLYSVRKKEILESDFLKDAARIELGLRNFLLKGNFKAFTTNFEDLHGLPQLPGLAVQRLMSEGYGFGAEGDWKTSALVRSMKVMANGLEGGTSFMEDYTYHLEPGNNAVLGAHMLEICPSISGGKARLEIHPLSIGGKEDPARLVFKAEPGRAINASLIDLGNRFRLLLNPVRVLDCPDMPKLPVASVLWKPEPDLKTSAQAWILAGGAHHTGFSTALDSRYMQDFGAMLGIETVNIDAETNIEEFKKELRWNELFFHFAKGIR
ncbi:MAG: L-arabinose isomerase [Bacteroidales bacterium]|nr:L-arabinose isomerase [Bacteroidales bacterium]